AKELYQTYRSMMDNDQIDIFVIGDVVEAEVAALFQYMNSSIRLIKRCMLQKKGGRNTVVVYS
ncbi:hypothetical protein ACM20Q_16475, partial [Enterococcus casseliflavus]